jgi:hypothetical protein
MPWAEDRAKADQALARANSIQDPKRGRIGSGEALIAGLVAALAGAAGARNAIPSLQNYLGTKQGLLDQEYGDAQKGAEAQRQAAIAQYQAALDAEKGKRDDYYKNVDDQRMEKYYNAQIDNWKTTQGRLEKGQDTRAQQGDLKILQGFGDRMAVDPEDAESSNKKFAALKKFATDNQIDVPDELLQQMSQPNSKDWMAAARKFNVQQVMPQKMKLTDEQIKKAVVDTEGSALSNKIKDRQWQKLGKELEWWDKDRALRNARFLAWENVALGNLAARVRGQDRALHEGEVTELRRIFQQKQGFKSGEIANLRKDLAKAKGNLDGFKMALSSSSKNDPDYERLSSAVEYWQREVDNITSSITQGEIDLASQESEFNRIMSEGTRVLTQGENSGGVGSDQIIKKAEKGRGGKTQALQGEIPPMPVAPPGVGGGGGPKAEINLADIAAAMGGKVGSAAKGKKSKGFWGG